MSSIGTFGSFTQARLAIYASQAGLTVTGNNISNINTEGYTRQKLNQTSFYAGGADRYYSKLDIRVGNGTLCTGVSQLRDPYLDIRYRNEAASVGAMDTKLSVLEQIEQVLDEIGDGEDGFGVIADQLSDLYNQLAQLSDQTGQEEYDILVRSSAQTLTNLLNSYAAQLEEVRQNTITSFNNDVTAINTILRNIQNLSESIRKADIHGDNALELRDERNVLIDKLASYMKIDVTYSEEDIGGGTMVEKLTIKLGNANPDVHTHSDETVLVDGIYVRQLVAKFPDENTDNFDIRLSELTDSKNRVMYHTELAKQEYTTDYPGESSLMNTDPATGVITITTYAKTNSTQPKKNPHYDPTLLASFQYLKADGSGTNNADEANKDSQGNPVENTAYDLNSITLFQYLKTDDSGTNDVKEAQQLAVYYMKEYTKTPSVSVDLKDNDMLGSLQALREMLTEEGEFASPDDLNRDPDASSKRGIPYYQQVLDLFAKQLADTFNAANQGWVYNEKKQFVDSNGTPLILDGTAITTSSYNALTSGQKARLDAYGANQGWQETGDQLLGKYLTEHGIAKGAVLFSNNGNGNDTNGITASNISISDIWASGPQLVTSFEQHSGLGIASTDASNILHMMSLLNDETLKYNPQDIAQDAKGDLMFTGSFSQMWNNIGTVLGDDMDTTTKMLDNFYAAATELDSSRDSVSSVDLNDEAMNLMQYSKSYNAACRLMTTIDSVLDKLINGTGMTR